MAESDGVLGDGSQLWLTSSADVLTKVKGLMSVNRPTLSVAKVEATDHDSNKTKEYIPGHGDVPELTATLKYEPGSATDLLILEHLASREKRAFKIVTVEEDGTTQDNTGSVFLMTYVPDNAPLGGIRTATLTGQPGPLLQAATTV
ncbi:phage tail tube protein [Novosphingobium album (ex Liu et al. 2023)]|uniref:Phage tail tube protein n=1 Tax=Novosphingobium album (ex Liu et al. 2023) TaxID=3031130 RepID=A0ABT5WPB8_9SPHN|nr:phage tail tube protein [Novosphingobium album (ex Liu et al. 2023)]MDE8651873.1 phage tail tube protein [Novosphingobium album (ex Liu et al. 2023)]